MKITPGRTVLYTLSAQDAEEITRRRTTGNSIADRIKEDKWPVGAQAHIGNPVQAGDTFPAVAVRVSGEGDYDPPVNLQVLLDGNDVFWATSRHEDPDAGKVSAGIVAAHKPGTWHWPARA